MSERRYCQWSGNPKGVPENPKRCIEEVMDGYFIVQCKRKRGHGPDGLYCKQHAAKLAPPAEEK